MVIVLICRSFVKVLGNPGCAPGSNFEICCAMLSEIWFSSCFTFVHYISLILSCILNPSATHTRDSACGNLVDLVMWSSPSLRDLLRLQVHLSVCFSCSVVSDSLQSPRTISCQALPLMEFSRQEYWSGLPFSVGGLLESGAWMIIITGREIHRGPFSTSTGKC